MGYRYNVLTGIERVKTHTKRYIFGGIATATIVAGASGAAFAAGTSCNAGHGAPGGFGTGSANYSYGPLGDDGVGADFGSASNNFGQEQGVVTGQNNSAYSAYCKQ